MPGVNEIGIEYTLPEIMCVGGCGQSSVKSIKLWRIWAIS